MLKKDKELTFEENLKKLEDIVDKLESGEIDLEKSVELYEKGMILKKNCEEKLKKVELQIKQVKLGFNKNAEVTVVADIEMKTDSDLDSLFLCFFTILHPSFKPIKC